MMLVFTPALTQGQSVYKCKSPSGAIVLSDVACAAGTRQESVTHGEAPAGRTGQQPTAHEMNARLLDNKVAAAIGSGDLSRAREIALTPEHWQWINEAEQGRRSQQPAGRTQADVQADMQGSSACKEAKWSYEVESSSIAKNAAKIDASRRQVNAACGLREPDTTVVSAPVVRERRPPPAPPAPGPMRCKIKEGGQAICW